MANYTVVPSPTEKQIREARAEAYRKAAEMASEVKGVSGESNAMIREILPAEDLEDGTDNGWNGTDREWIQDTLTADSLQETYTIDSGANAEDKVIVFYGVKNVGADPLTSEVQFEDGNGAPIFRFNTQDLAVDPEEMVLFNYPIWFGSSDDGSINQWPNAAGDDYLKFYAIVAEGLSETFSPNVNTGE